MRIATYPGGNGRELLAHCRYCSCSASPC